LISVQTFSLGLHSSPEKTLHKRVVIVFRSYDEKEKIKIPLAAFKKGGTGSPFYEGGWGDLFLFHVSLSSPRPMGNWLYLLLAINSS